MTYVTQDGRTLTKYDFKKVIEAVSQLESELKELRASHLGNNMTGDINNDGVNNEIDDAIKVPYCFACYVLLGESASLPLRLATMTMQGLLMFSQFTLALDVLEEYCEHRFGPKGVGYFRLDGGTNRIMREMDVNAFNAAGSTVPEAAVRARGLALARLAASACPSARLLARLLGHRFRRLR